MVSCLWSLERLAEVIRFGWIKKHCFVIYSDHKNVCELGGTTGQLLPLTLQEAVLGEWNGYVLLIHQLDNQTVWRVGWMKRLLLFDLHSGTIHSPFYICLLALLVEKIFEINPTSPKALTCWISQILNIYFTCIEYTWSVQSENHIGPKKKVVALNRLFHGSLQFWN